MRPSLDLTAPRRPGCDGARHPTSAVLVCSTDRARGRLVIARMGDGEVVVVSLADGATLARVPDIGTVRGVAVAASIGRIFATAAATSQLVAIDATTLTEVGRVSTGSAPDGVAWDPADQVVGVSDQRDGALSLIAGGGTGTRTQVRLGAETGNVVYHPARGRFWIAVVLATGADQLVAIDAEQPDPSDHAVAADPTTQRVYFPLSQGPGGAPVLRVMGPSGT
jgi:DNA-binding beta-propeller fold protein YncE